MDHSPEPSASVLPRTRAYDPLDADLVHAKVSEGLFSGPPPATRVGRFVLIERVGAGGMGRVYSAYDPKLDRKVAIKVLHEDPEGWEQGILLREARALARLSHRNVVTVYEVGTNEAGRGSEVFLAMEFVEGMSLDRWMNESPGATAVIDAFIAAGDGIMAAHTAELVHRDIKPSNIMMRADGHVVVLDFGLARIPPPDRSPTGDRGDDSSGLTIRGVVGTPAYMAPESRRGEAATPLSDQFSYCVSLYEALNGRRPFEATPRKSSAETCDIPPSEKHVPAWLHSAMVRGLSMEPSQRWPSMAALVAKLRRHRGGKRRRVLAIGVGLGVALMAGWWFSTLFNDTCRDATQGVEAIWSDNARADVSEALRGMGPDSQGEKAVQHIDDYVQALREAQVDACKGRRSIGPAPASREVTTCLDGQADKLAETVALLATPDDNVLGHVYRLLPTQDELRACHAVAPMHSAAEPEFHREIERALSRATALSDAGRAEDGLEVARGVMERARERSAPGLAARAGVTMGRALAYAGRYSEASTTLRAALVDAEQADDQLPRMAALRELGKVLVEESRFDEAEHVVEIAAAAQGRFEDRPLAWDASLEAVRGDIAFGRTNYELALEHYRRLQTLTESPSLPPATSLSARSRVVSALIRLRHFDEALEILDTLDRDMLALWGPDYVGLAINDSTRGVILYSTEDNAGAKAAFLSALALRERIHGPDHPSLSAVLINLGGVLERSAPAEAVAVLERALPMVEQSHGSRSRRAAKAHYNLGRAQLQLDEVEAARAAFEVAFTIDDEIGDANDRERLLSENRLALAELALGRCEHAVPRFEDVLANTQRGSLYSAELRVQAWVGRARCLARQGHLDDALADAEQAWSACKDEEIEALDAADAALTLAEIRRQGGHDTASVEPLVTRAREMIARSKGLAPELDRRADALSAQ